MVNISLFGCAVGGMAGIKRPAEESNEAPSEKKNQPVTAKVFASPKPATENKTPKPANENKVQYVTRLTSVNSYRNFKLFDSSLFLWSVCNGTLPLS